MIAKNNTLILMCGLPRSGKSTYVNKYKDKYNAIVICPDEIRFNIFGHQFHKPAEDYIWAIAKTFARLLLSQNKNVIIDATNLTFEARNVWIKLAEEYYVNLKIIWIRTSVEQCVKRNKNSPIGKKLPEGRIEEMYNTIDAPYLQSTKRPFELIEIENNHIKRDIIFVR